MANKILITPQDGTPKQISFADHAGDFSPAAAGSLEVGTPTDCQITLASLADGSARQSAKADLGAKWAARYHVRAALEFAVAPTVGDTVDLYWAPSGSGTAANGNAANITGSDAAYSGYSSNLDASVKQLIFVGSVICTAQATTTVQYAEVQCPGGFFQPPERYGSLVVRNESGQALHSDDVEIHIVFDPVVDEVQ